MGIMFPWDGNKCRETAAGTEENCAGILAGILTLMVYLALQKFVFELLNDVSSDFTDTDSSVNCQVNILFR